MTCRRLLSLFLTGVCLMVWAGPGFALRAPQRAGDSSGLEEITDAISGQDQPLPLEKYFEIIPGKSADAPRVLFTFPPNPDIVRLYQAEGVELFVALPGVEPLGAEPAVFHQLVRQVDPDYLEIFVNEKIDAALLDKTVTPRLRGIHSMGLGFGNIDLVAAARRGIHPTYVGGDENPLRWATAEMAEALALAGRFDLRRRVAPAAQATPPKQLLGGLLRKLAQRRGIKDHTVQQLLWAQLMRQMRKLDEAGQMVQEDRARGAGNGPLRTVEGHQLAADLKGSGIQTSLGLLPGSALDLARWGALARAHGVHKLFYTGERHEIFETRYGMVYIPSVFGLLRASDYVLRAPDGPGLPQPLLDSVGAGRDYPWLVDPDRLALTEATSAADQKQLLGSGLDKKITVGTLGLGSIGSIAAADLRPMGIQLLSVIHDVGKRDRYERLASELEGIEYVDLPEIVSRSDVLILALPETDETKGILTLELLNGIGSDREVVIVNVGRGSVVGAAPEEEQAFAAWLKAHPNVRYYTDVLRNEFLPAAEQPLLDPALAAQVFYSGHIASNTADPTGHRTRSAMGRTQFENFRADRNGLPPPNPVPMPAEAEDLLSRQN